jgi:uncharacterized protein (TIGR00255 family)
MIRSMTGFGEATANAEGVHYFLELRSLNNKYFKTSIRLPEELQALEPEIETHLRRRLTRGTITCVVKVSDTSADAAVSVNHGALSRYIQQVRATPEVADGSVPLALGPLLELPGVLQPPTDEESRIDRARAVLKDLLDEALEHLVSMRQREGVFLVEDLMGHHDVIAGRLALIAEQAPSAVREYEQRLRQRVETMLADAGVRAEPVDIIREVAVYAEKSDISEEVARLGGHLEQYASLLSGAEDRPVGRTLDFLAQEMLREANTIASKSADAQISRATVEVKGAIDRIKEQVQNVE